MRNLHRSSLVNLRLNRRRWLAVTAAIATIQYSSVSLAQTPIMRSTSSSESVAGRVVRLQGIDAGVERVVVTSIAADPRGELLAVAGDDHLIRILEMHTMRVREVLREHRDLVRTMAFDIAGDRLVTAGNDGQLIVWQRGDQFERQQTMRGTPALSSVRFSPDGKMMAAVGFASEIYLIGRTNNEFPTLTCGCNDLRAVAFRGDGELLAVGGRSGELHLFNMRTGKLDEHAGLHSGRIRDLVFGPNSNDIISVAEDGNVIVYDTVGRREKHRVELPSGRCFCAAVIDSQRVAVAGSDNTIRIINTDDGKIMKTLTGHDGSVSSLAASGGILFSGGYDATIRRWLLNEGIGQERIAETESGAVEKK